ncbi:hypothetical protein SAMN05421505_112104 [Sinosporangium album]|uniref:Uncharacterized protein n=1 Tax=Sinosporangium album TaxID=504805 RepID=A0A1G8ACV0_9ACTN|nr:hypothetical protein SAMN05421505_112104 [Sinosporangium album]
MKVTRHIYHTVRSHVGTGGLVSLMERIPVDLNRREHPDKKRWLVFWNIGAVIHVCECDTEHEAEGRYRMTVLALQSYTAGGGVSPPPIPVK